MQCWEDADWLDVIINDEIDKKNNNYNINLLKKDKNERFYEWLAGVIDGDGCFLLTKKRVC